MGRLIVTPDDSFSGVYQGGVATLSLGRVNRLHQTNLDYAKAGVLADQATIETDIEWIEVKIGSAVQRKIYPVELFKMEAERNRTFKAGRIPIRLSDPSKRTMVGQDATSWNLEVFQTVSLRVKIKSDAANVDPSLVAHLLKTPLRRDPSTGAQQEDQGLIITDRRVDVEVTDTTKTVILQPENGRQISSIHCFSSDIDKVTVELPGREKQEFSPNTLNGFIEDEAFSPQADLVSFLGEAMTGRYGDVENLGNLPLKLKFELSAANNFVMLVKELGDRIR